MTAKSAILETLIDRIVEWPIEAKEELARSMQAIEKKHGQVYHMSDEEWAAVQDGLAQARRGEFVSDGEMSAFWKKHGL